MIILLRKLPLFKHNERQKTSVHSDAQGSASECPVSKITNDGLTRSGTGGCFTAVPIWQQWVSRVKTSGCVIDIIIYVKNLPV